MSPLTSSRYPARHFLQQLSLFLKAMAVFAPGLIILGLAALALIGLDQGQDLLVVSREQPWVALFIVLAIFYWVLTSWYTARIISYNREDLYKKAQWPMYHFPRILGYGVLAVVMWAIVKLDAPSKHASWIVPAILVLDAVAYYTFHRWFRRQNEEIKTDHQKESAVLKWRKPVQWVVAVSVVAVIFFWKKPWWLLVTFLLIIQLGFLYLVVFRKSIGATILAAQKEPLRSPFAQWFRTLMDRYSQWVFNGKVNTDNERFYFYLFHATALIASVTYLAAAVSLKTARALTPLPFVLLAFATLLGAGNFLTLVSIRKRINIHFVLFVIAFVMGLLFESHPVRVIQTYDSSRVYDRRPGLHQYLYQWVNNPARSRYLLADSGTKPFPVFFVLANGGASRSGYWVAAALSELADNTQGGQMPFANHIFCLSGASGGSVGNGAFLAAMHLKQQGSTSSSYASLCQSWLDNDFLSFTLSRMLGPELVKPFVPGLWGDRAHALEKTLEVAQESADTSDILMSRVMASDMASLVPDSTASLPLLCINTTRVQDGSPGVVATLDIDSAFFGRRVDVLDLMCAGERLRMSTAVILGARFPYVSPGGKLGKSYFVDGGYFDNSGAGVVHEMLQELNWLKRSEKNYTALSDSAYHIVKRALQHMNFYVIHLSNSPGSELKLSRIHPLINDLATPVQTLVGSYSTQTTVNNTRLVNYLRTLDRVQNGGNYVSLNLYGPGDSTLYPMNWVISDRARMAMDKRAKQIAAIDSICARLNRGLGNHLFDSIPVEN